ncbi:hypothetical protein BJ170DRAFT_592862 [Xylariales sp. AK1849]|nr:hypothetical protein BJ170DRAFT_592862 [Xylariales sp. AK1849]
MALTEVIPRINIGRKHRDAIMASAETPIADLWQVAIQKLVLDVKDILVQETGDELHVLASLLREAELQKQQCLQKRIKFRIRGKQIVLRDAFDKVISWVKDFSSVVDVAVSLDPGHAALPWAGVRFLLQYIESWKAFIISPLFKAELKKISELDTELQKLARIADAQVTQELHGNVSIIQKLLESLTSTSPRIRVIDGSSVYSKILEDGQFRPFLNGSRLLNIPNTTLGIPRIGSSALLDGHLGIPNAFLSDKQENPLAVPLTYFYCGDARFGHDRVGFEEVLRSLTRQLAVIDRARHEIHGQALAEYERRAAEARLDGFETPKLRTSDCV